MPSPQKSPDKVSSRPRLTVWKKVLFSTVVVVSVFAITELLLSVAKVETVIDLEDPFRGFSGLVKVFERDGDHYQTRQACIPTFNQQGFLREKPLDGLRIFCLGGSSSYGFPWGAEAAFTSILGDLLAASHPDRHVEAINASGVSYAMHRLNIIADELLEYQPDVFVIYSGHNEFIEPVFMKALKGRNRLRTRVEYLAAHSRIYSGIWKVVHRPRRQTAANRNDVGVNVLRDHGIFSPTEKDEVVAEFRWRLARLVRRAQATGVRVVLVTVPCNERDWSPEASGTITALDDQERRSWSEAFAAGKRALSDGQLEVARAQLERAISIAAGHAESQYLLGKTYDSLQRWDKARDAYRRACDADASPIRRLSAINEATRAVAQEHDALLIDADRIFREHSEHGLVGFNLIKDYVHPTREGHELLAWHIWDAVERAGWLGRKATAKRNIFEGVIAQRPQRLTTNNAVWFFNQGVLLEKQNQPAAAIENYQQAVRIRPNYVPALSNLGALLAQNGQTDAAVRVLEQAIAIDPEEPGVHNNLGSALQTLGRLEEAAAHFQSELQITGPDQANVHRNLGITMQHLGRFEDAAMHYQEALRIDPDSPLAHTYWGSLLLQQGQVKDAAVHFERAVQLDPDLADNYSNLGVALMRLRRFEEAIANYQQALQLRPDYAVAHKNLGLAFAQHGDLLAAVSHFQQALKLEPNLPGVRNNLRRAQAMLQQRGLPNP